MGDDPKPDAARFARAKQLPGYRAAMALDLGRQGSGIATAVAMLVVGGGLSVVAGIASGWVVGGAAGAVALAMTAVSIRAERGPIHRQLAIVDSSWSGLTGSSAEVQSVSRSLTLRFEDRTVQSFSASGAVAVQNEGDIGVACMRGRRLIRFEVLDA